MRERLRVVSHTNLIVEPSERDRKLLQLAPIAKAYLYESDRVNNLSLDPKERVKSKILRDAFMGWMIEDSHQGGKILGELIDFQQWDFERTHPNERT